MRSASWARWATCALAVVIPLSISLSAAFADRTARSLSSCTAFDQADKGDDKVQFTIHNTCTVPVDCSITWRVVCAPESKKRRAVHAGAAKLALTNNSAQSAEASAAICGDASWSLDGISWSCQPNNE